MTKSLPLPLEYHFELTRSVPINTDNQRSSVTHSCRIVTVEVMLRSCYNSGEAFVKTSAWALVKIIHLKSRTLITRRRGVKVKFELKTRHALVMGIFCFSNKL